MPQNGVKQGFKEQYSSTTIDFRTKKGSKPFVLVLFYSPVDWESINKIKRNIERDRDIDRELRAGEWTVLRFWGKDIKKDPDACVAAIEEAIFSKKFEDTDVDDQDRDFDS